MGTAARWLATVLLLTVACAAETRSPYRAVRTIYFAEGSAALSADEREILLRLGCLGASAELVIVVPHASSSEKRDLARLRAEEARRVLKLGGARASSFYIEDARWHVKKESKLVNGWNQRIDVEVVVAGPWKISCEWQIPEGKLPPRA